MFLYYIIKFCNYIIYINKLKNIIINNLIFLIKINNKIWFSITNLTIINIFFNYLYFINNIKTILLKINY